MKHEMCHKCAKSKWSSVCVQDTAENANKGYPAFLCSFGLKFRNETGKRFSSVLSLHGHMCFFPLDGVLSECTGPQFVCRCVCHCVSSSFWFGVCPFIATMSTV